MAHGHQQMVQSMQIDIHFSVFGTIYRYSITILLEMISKTK